MPDNHPIALIGVGNPDCGDDGVGPRLIDQLEQTDLPEVVLLKASGETAGLIEILSEHTLVILIDAIAAQTEPGRIHRFDATSDPLPAEFFSNMSTHSMGVDEALEMARVLGEFPSRVIVFGMEGIYFEAGDTMCPQVLKKLDDLSTAIRTEIESLQTKSALNSN